MTNAALHVINSSSTFLFKPAVMIIAVVLLVVAMTMAQTSFAVDDRVYSIQVVNEFTHDPSAFTQGLLYEGNNTLFESTGLNGQSSVRKVNLQTAKIEALHKMNDSEFGEGLTLLGDRLYQLTWMQKTGFIYDKHNLSKFETFTHHMNDGWGFATDGKVLFGSDGSSSLYQIDPQTMKVIAEKVIKYNDQEVHNLNELEYINNEVWANIWMYVYFEQVIVGGDLYTTKIDLHTIREDEKSESDCIVRISPTDGNVMGWILLPELRNGLIDAGYNIDVLNGIAWDADNKRIFVTGKLWPKLYEIKLHPRRKPLRSSIEKMCLISPAVLLSREV